MVCLAVNIMVVIPKVKVNLHAEYQCRTSNSSAGRVSTDGRTDRRYQVHYLLASLKLAVDNKIKHPVINRCFTVRYKCDYVY